MVSFFPYRSNFYREKILLLTVFSDNEYLWKEHWMEQIKQYCVKDMPSYIEENQRLFRVINIQKIKILTLYYRSSYYTGVKNLWVVSHGGNRDI